jgi:hypothetical protein
MLMAEPLSQKNPIQKSISADRGKNFENSARFRMVAIF